MPTKQAAAIVGQHRAGYTIRELADAYGRDPRTIRRIVEDEDEDVDPDAVRAAPPLPDPDKYRRYAAMMAERRRR